MDETERVEIFERIATALSKNGLEWIVTQVTEQIHIGKTEFKEVDTVRRSGDSELLSLGPDQATTQLRHGPKAQFPTTVEYTNKEKLSLLLDGMLQALHALEMEEKVFDRIKTIEPGVGSEVSFFSEASGVIATRMSSGRTGARDQLVSDCSILINRLREESDKN